MGKITDPSKLAGFPALRSLRVLATEEHTLRLLLQGLSVQQIASEMATVPGTVKWRLRELKSKLGVKNLVTLAVRVTQLGFPESEQTRTGLPEGLPGGLTLPR